MPISSASGDFGLDYVQGYPRDTVIGLRDLPRSSSGCGFHNLSVGKFLGAVSVLSDLLASSFPIKVNSALDPGVRPAGRGLQEGYFARNCKPTTTEGVRPRILHPAN